MKLNELYQSKQISIRSYRALKNFGIGDLEAIKSYYRKHGNFLTIRNCGRKSSEELCLLVIDENEFSENFDLLENYFYQKKLSKKALTSCLQNDIRSLDRLINFYRENEDFLTWTNCGFKTNIELIEFCESFIKNSCNPIQKICWDENHWLRNKGLEIVFQNELISMSRKTTEKLKRLLGEQLEWGSLSLFFSDFKRETLLSIQKIGFKTVDEVTKIHEKLTLTSEKLLEQNEPEIWKFIMIEIKESFVRKGLAPDNSSLFELIFYSEFIQSYFFLKEELDFINSFKHNKIDDFFRINFMYSSDFQGQNHKIDVYLNCKRKLEVIKQIV